MNLVELKNQLFNPKTNKYQILAQLKSDSGFDNFNKALNTALKHPLTKKVLESTPLPKTYTELRQNRIVPATNNLESEIAWNLYTIKLHSSEIKKFINNKNAFEKSFLLNEFEKAEGILNEMERDCKSLWSIENQLLLREYKDGAEGNWSTLDEFTKSIKDPFVLLFVENYSKRAESKVSYFRYRNLLANQLEDLGLPPSLYEYFCFRLNYPAYTGFESYPFFLAVESISSVHDRYLLLIDIISEMVLNSKINKNELFKKVINDLIELIPNDVRLQRLSSYLLKKSSASHRGSQELFSILDYYTKGDYDYCLIKIPELINEFPESIELYELFVKSLIESNKEFKPLGISSLTDTILENLYNVFYRNERFTFSTEELLKLSLSFFSTTWGKQLYGLISEQSQIGSQNNKQTLSFILNSKFNNPRILNFTNNDEGKKFFEELFKDFPENKALKVNKLVNEGNVVELANDVEISKARKAIYIGRALLKAEMYAEVKDHYELSLQKKLSPTVHEEAICHLFLCYIKLVDYKSAIQLYVENHLVNSNYTARLDKELLLSKLEEPSIVEIENLIDLPIFYRLATLDPYKQYVAYDTYMESQGFQKPSELLNSEVAIDKRKVVFFLKEVCTVEVLHYSLYFDGSDDIENERLDILRQLLTYNKENESGYIKEITEISQNSNIKKAIREVNKGRITVNVQQLKNIEANNIREGFNRYQELANYSKDKDVSGIDVSTKKFKEYLSNWADEKVRSKVVFVNDPAFITFKVMFLEIRDKFILSKEYGLDGYLSTRIRHGTLENHIRSIFESLKLVSRKSKEGEYFENEYWNDKIPYQLINKKSEIQNAFKKFSKEVDDTIEFIIKELIQVKTEKYQTKNKALFDYSLNQEQLAHLFSATRENIKDYTSFLDFVFEFLEAHTKILLDRIRENFLGEIKNKFDLIISDFQFQLKKIIDNYPFVDLTSSIVKCSTDIQNELRNISEWFHLSNPSTDLVLDIRTLIQTSVEITNTIYPNNKIHPLIITEFEIPLIGTIHLIYITRILFDNIIKHSGLDSSNLNVEVKAELIEDRILRLGFKNNLSDNINLSYLEHDLAKTKAKWGTDKYDYEKINVEGGSGFDKIRRILAFDMRGKNYDFNYLLEEGSLTIFIDIDIKLENI